MATIVGAILGVVLSSAGVTWHDWQFYVVILVAVVPLSWAKSRITQ